MSTLAGVVGDHLWQSTLFLLAAALTTLVLRRHAASVRYWIWLAASVKFLVPFAALMMLGDSLDMRRPVPFAPPVVSTAIEIAGQPFSSAGIVEPLTVAAAAAGGPDVPVQGLLVAGWAAGALLVAAVWVIRWRRVAATLRAAAAATSGRELDILRRLECRLPRPGTPLPLVISPGTLEPGVFGILRPVLLWPESIGRRLTDQQVEAIIAHELAHVHRRDNLTAAVHMLVQSLCWFHPAVWWIGARLVDERERACDQDVIRFGSEPAVYAEGILKTVQFYLESPLACVSGVTGSDLKQRIEDIMHNRGGIALTSWKKAALVAAGVATLAAPLLVDRVDAQTPAAAPAGERLTFESASVKPNRSGEMRVMMRQMPGGAYEATNVTARAMIQQAMGVAEFQLIGVPDWADTERYDILAKSPAGAAPAEFAARYRSLVEDRFKLKTHRETRELPVYALVLARSDGRLGSSLVPSKSDCSPEAMAAMRAQMNGPAPAARGGGVPMMMSMPPMPPLGQPRPCTSTRSGGQIMAGGATLPEIVRMIQQNTGRIVLDRSGLMGRFDFDLRFTPDPALSGRGMGGGLPPDPTRPPPPADPNATTIFSAVQEQLGLKLESTRGPVEVVVIDSIEKASEN